MKTHKEIGKESPLASVIILAHTRREFLEYAVNSVLPQDYGNFEIIIVRCFLDKGSMSKYKGIDVKTLTLPSNASFGEMLLAATNEARGSILLFLDDDDVFLPGKISKIMEAFVKSPSIVAIRNLNVQFYGEHEFESGNTMGNLEENYERSVEADEIVAPIDVSHLFRLIEQRFNSNLSTISVRRSVVLKNQELLSCNFPTDVMMGLAILRSGGLVKIEKTILNGYRIGSSNQTARGQSGDKGIIRLTNTTLKEIAGLDCASGVLRFLGTKSPIEGYYISYFALNSFIRYCLLTSLPSKRALVEELMKHVLSLSRAVGGVKLLARFIISKRVIKTYAPTVILAFMFMISKYIASFLYAKQKRLL